MKDPKMSDATGSLEPQSDAPWICPACRRELAGADRLTCPGCGKSASREGRLFDFQELTPHGKLGLNELLADVHEAISGHYTELGEDTRVRRSLARIRALAKGGRALEIGGANGPMTAMLETLFEQVYSIDYSESFLRAIVSRTSKTICILGDAHFLPFADQSLDFIVCTEVLEHVVTPTQLLLEMRRVLRPQGHLYLTVPNWVSPNPFRLAAKDLFHPMETHVNFYDAVSLQTLLVRCGYDIERVRTLKDTRAVLKHALRHWYRPFSLRALLPAWGMIIECVARPAADPTLCWRNFVERYG